MFAKNYDSQLIVGLSAALSILPHRWHVYIAPICGINQNHSHRWPFAIALPHAPWLIQKELSHGSGPRATQHWPDSWKAEKEKGAGWWRIRDYKPCVVVPAIKSLLSLLQYNKQFPDKSPRAGLKSGCGLRFGTMALAGYSAQLTHWHAANGDDDDGPWNLWQTQIYAF